MLSLPRALGPNTVWFITGCSSGLGQSFAKFAYNAGHCVVATARHVESLSYLQDEPNVLKLSLDVTSSEAITNSLTVAVEKFGRIDVVINNAGYSLVGDSEAIPEADSRLQMDTNFWGPVRITQEAVRIFREVNASKQGGTIIQISSMGGWLTYPGNAFYHDSKSALEAFTETISKEMHPDWNIHFLIVAPAGVRTNYAGSSLKVATRHPAYKSANNPITAQLQHMADTKLHADWLDPDTCATVLFNVVTKQHERPMPMRLLMGENCYKLIKNDIEDILGEIDAWKEETLQCF